ncbi:putative haloacid type ii [Diaporthe ampelina]|uniref:Putative haloacid type ii n=1 Tax=Diaporthe ampelina TaxID=1214573 RepID=A0A0G2FYY1_9PEZI|nr:putative haloacid type ii [Diaporthe ampelina]
MPIKAVLFDFMGTCLDWHSAVKAALPSSLPEETRSQFALAWRQAYFDHNAARLARGQPPEDIDLSHRAALSAQLASAPPEVQAAFADDPGAEEACVAAWHSQPAWPDVAPALERLRAGAGHGGVARDVDVLVHANGTARLQLDLCRSSGLRFDALLASELLGVYKPAPEGYRRALELLRCEAGECVMVAAHAYDTRGAKAVGMKTVYVYRWTDDINENQAAVRRENDAYLEGMDGLAEAVARLGLS